MKISKEKTKAMFITRKNKSEEKLWNRKILTTK